MPIYQWHRDGTLLATQSPTDRFSLSPLGQADAGNYTCTVTRGTMTNTSEPVSIDVLSKCGWALCMTPKWFPSYYSLTQQTRTCKIMQESCKNLACKTCTQYVPFLAQSCTNSCKILQKCARNAGNYSCSNSCKILHHFLQDMCKIPFTE